MNNSDAISDIINDLGFCNVVKNNKKRELRFSREEGRNPTSMRLNLDTMNYYCFSTNEKGNIYSLIMKKKSISFPESLHYLTNKLGLDEQQFAGKTKLPFGGFYKEILRQQKEPETSIKTYDDSILYPYSNKFNTMFFHDGISFETQRDMMIGYDIETQRITIPIWTLDGNLCGIMGRLNDLNCAKEDRWLPIIPCPRSLTLYGYHKNYETIQDKGLVIIGESEKMVMQMHTMGSYIGIATGGSFVSDTQAKYIKGLMVPRIIIGYDEGLAEDLIREQAMKVKVENAVFKNKVGYVWDERNKLLPKGSKASPTDLEREVFLTLIKQNVRWL